MARRFHNYNLPRWLGQYCDSRTLDLKKYDEWHYGLTDGGFTRVDIWTTGKYNVVFTNYYLINRHKTVIERSGERGSFSFKDRKQVGRFLDHLFFDADV